MTKQAFKVLYVIAHPNLAKSLGNKSIIESYFEEGENTEHIDTEYDDLYKLYPDYKIDVKAEQEKLIKADVVILQFPMYWYNCPSLMRKWFEDVFEHGFAYGSKGKALLGKRMILSITVGAPEEAFQEGGFQNYTIEDLTKGFHQFANICNMTWDGFIVTYGLTYFIREKPEEYKAMIVKLRNHGKALADRVNYDK
eukprot:jgi/Orpsp1_1/1183956/evm.model.c7180000087380.1